MIKIPTAIKAYLRIENGIGVISLGKGNIGKGASATKFTFNFINHIL